MIQKVEPPIPIRSFKAHVVTRFAREMLQGPLFIFPIISILLLVLMRNDLSLGLFQVLGIFWLNSLIGLVFWLYLKTYRLFIYEDGFAVGNLVRENTVWFWSFYSYSDVKEIDYKFLEFERGRIKIYVKNRRFRIRIDPPFEEEFAIWCILCEKVDKSKLTKSTIERLKIVAREIRREK